MILPFSVHTEDNSVWTVFFMKKGWKRVLLCGTFALLICAGAVLTGKTTLLPSPETALQQIRQDTAALTDGSRMTAYLEERIPVLAETVKALNLGWLGGNWWLVQFPDAALTGPDTACAAQDNMDSTQVEIRFAVVDLWKHMKNLMISR